MLVAYRFQAVLVVAVESQAVLLAAKRFWVVLLVVYRSQAVLWHTGPR